METSKSRKKVQTFSTDSLAKHIARLLVEDLRPHAELAPFSGAGELRESLVANYTPLDPYSFKKEYQLANLFKKYTFENDVYTPAELIEKAESDFTANQERLRRHVIPSDDKFLNVVLAYTRGWIDSVLLDLENEDLLELCRWAKKSSVGVPNAKANLGQRLELPITGSSDQISWFQRNYLSWHPTLCNYVQEKESEIPLGVSPFLEISELNAVLVSKTYKSLRMIVPNTTIGGFYSNGLGRLMQKRLAAAGYDIRKLQHVHRWLAQEGSRTGQLVTNDQKAASDNITAYLINTTFPARWALALTKGRISRVRLPSGASIDCETFSTMGIGFTFPLQTILFLGLLHGIRLAAGIQGQVTISGYGDDLIYDRRLHPYVVDVFPKLGLVINTDKTFAEGPFRESCGGDYFRGVDVRPFFFPEEGGRLTARKYEAYLYKIINGLTARWDRSEIRHTHTWLIQHLVGTLGIKPLLVPEHYGDDTGVRPSALPPALRKPWVGNLGVRRDIHGTLEFPYLKFEVRHKEELRHGPYLLDRLRVISETDDRPEAGILAYGYRSNRHFTLHETLRIMSDNQIGEVFLSKLLVWPFEQTFVELAAEEQPPNYRSNLTGKRLRKSVTTVSQDGGRYRVQSGTTFLWA